MAKQRGIHQISGKVNNLCYYEQKYVRGGLIRRINEGMSLRLKEDPAFENTRKANRLFGLCSLYARLLLSLFDYLSDVITIPSRQAKLTRSILGFFRSYYAGDLDATYTLRSFQDSELLHITDVLFKNNLQKFFPSLIRLFPDLGLEESFVIKILKSELEAFVFHFGVDFVSIRVAGGYIIGDSNFDHATTRFDTPTINNVGQVREFIWSIGNDDLEITINPNTTGASPEYYAITLIPTTGANFLSDKRIFSGAAGGLIVAHITY